MNYPSNILPSGFLPPFNGARGQMKNRVFKPFFKQAGVYIIKEDGLVVYVGMSQSNVCCAMYRHFYPWAQIKTRPQRRVTYLDHDHHQYTCQVIETTSNEAIKMERGMIVSLKPRDNADRFEDYLNELTQKKQPAITEKSKSDDVPF